jgi:hypothetical protein
MSPKTDLSEILVSRGQLLRLGGFAPTDLSDFCARNDIRPDPTAPMAGMYPAFRIIQALNDERKNRRGKSTSKAEGETDLDREEKMEKVLKLRIANQERIKLLIKRDYAKRRVMTLLTAFSDKMKYIIKTTAVELANLIEMEKVKFGGVDARKIEMVLIDKLQEDAKIISWEEDDAENQLGRTELSPASGETVSGGSSEEDTSSVEE